MSKFREFYKFCKAYQTQLNIESELKSYGLIFDGEGKLSSNIDELISMIPGLIFNKTGAELFWNLLCLDYEFTDEYIEQLWEELKEFQL